MSEQWRLRSAEVTRASVDLAAETTCGGIVGTADRLEALLAHPTHTVTVIRTQDHIRFSRSWPIAPVPTTPGTRAPSVDEARLPRTTLCA